MITTKLFSLRSQKRKKNLHQILINRWAICSLLVLLVLWQSPVRRQFLFFPPPPSLWLIGSTFNFIYYIITYCISFLEKQKIFIFMFFSFKCVHVSPICMEATGMIMIIFIVVISCVSSYFFFLSILGFCLSPHLNHSEHSA